MRQLDMLRVGSSEKGTFGVLRSGQVPFALTLELPDRENQENISCIPAGVYRCRRVVSPKFGDVFELTQVPGRTHVLIHKANFLMDLRGCIAVGEEFAGTMAQPYLGDSKSWFDQFMTLLAGETAFEIAIRDVSRFTS